ncbi:PASTA domain-containing protein [Streptomyces sp. SID13726]|uniref:PASTA domain-containing protein n=1 Tax=Streptomyces sp. SID13726 TaxID=2706058 RepID=UPI0013BBDB7F|nr:PASTA domain-containing protein [Streptomyces sp. SID13726]NEA98966.1 PASTA domain-containing protein [Streptomyces sp. SID13726]
MTFSRFSSFVWDATAPASDAPAKMDSKGTDGLPWAFFVLLAVVVLAAVFAKIYQMIARKRNPEKINKAIDGGIVRAALALVSISALIFLTFLSLYTGVDADEELKTAVIAITAAVTAFYFSSKSSDSARRDIIQAVMKDHPSAPDIRGLTGTQAKKVLSGVNLRLHLAEGVKESQMIIDQDPAPGALVAEGKITVTKARE